MLCSTQCKGTTKGAGARCQSFSWKVYDDQITPPGMGVRFEEISEENQRLIAEVVKEHDLVKIAADYLDTLETGDNC